MKKKKVSENYLEKKPKRKDGLHWDTSEDGVCTLSVENRGFFNRLFQILLKKPKISYVHLDEMGSFLWPLFDGEEDLYSFIASIIYDKDYDDCCEWKNGKPNPEGKELRDKVKRFLIPVVEECGGISEYEED